MESNISYNNALCYWTFLSILLQPAIVLTAQDGGHILEVQRNDDEIKELHKDLWNTCELTMQRQTIEKCGVASANECKSKLFLVLRIAS